MSEETVSDGGTTDGGEGDAATIGTDTVETAETPDPTGDVSGVGDLSLSTPDDAGIPLPPAADEHSARVALAHESFRARIEGAYSELNTALDKAWEWYTREHGIVADVAGIASDLGGHSAGNEDPTTAR